MTLLIVSIVIFILLVLFFFATQIGLRVTPKIKWFMILASLAFLVFSIVRMNTDDDRIYRNGDEDKTGYSAPKISDISDGKVTVSIKGSVITVNDKAYFNEDEAMDALFAYISRGSGVRLIDNYALNETYVLVRDAVEQMGVKAEDVEEIKEL